jgi:hypothetical protein
MWFMLLSFAGFFTLLGVGSLGGFRGTPPPPDALRRVTGVEEIALARSKSDCSITFRLPGEPVVYSYGCTMPRIAQVHQALTRPGAVVAVARPSPSHPWAGRPDPEVWEVEQAGQAIVTYGETARSWEVSRQEQARIAGVGWGLAMLCAAGAFVSYRRPGLGALPDPAPA